MTQCPGSTRLHPAMSLQESSTVAVHAILSSGQSVSAACQRLCSCSLTPLLLFSKQANCLIEVTVYRSRCDALFEALDVTKDSDVYSFSGGSPDTSTVWVFHWLLQ